jgi:hypothetical protein
MKYRARKGISLVLAAVLILLFTAAASASDVITVKIRVYDTTDYTVYEVGTDTVQKASQGIQSEPYTIQKLSEFTAGTVGGVEKVVGNWYFPVSDQRIGSTVYFSNNSDTATITYWVNGYTPPVVSPPGSDTEPEPDPSPEQGEGDVITYFKVAYVDYEGKNITFGEKALTLKMDCTGSYCSHVMNCSIRLKDFHPDVLQKKGLEIKDGYQWMGWSKDSVSAVPAFGTFYGFTSSETTVQPRQTIYLVYQAKEPAASEPVVDDNLTVDGDGAITYLDAMMVMDYLAGEIALTDQQIAAADYDSDGVVTYLDAMAIMDGLAG